MISEIITSEGKFIKPFTQNKLTLKAGAKVYTPGNNKWLSATTIGDEEVYISGIYLKDIPDLNLQSLVIASVKKFNSGSFYYKDSNGVTWSASEIDADYIDLIKHISGGVARPFIYLCFSRLEVA